MNVSLTPELEKWIQAKVNSGLYTSSSEVIREALRLLHEFEVVRESQFAELHHKVSEGLTSLDAGRSKIFDEALMANIKSSGRQRIGQITE